MIAMPIKDEERTLFDWIALDRIFTAPYGRPLNQRRVEALAKHFDINAVGMLYLSYRDDLDMYAAIDGAHRTAAGRLAGVDKLPARIYIDLAYEEEAHLYVAFATVNKQDAIDRFRARLEEREPQAVQINRTLAIYGMKVQRGGQEGTVQAAAALDKVYDEFGQQILIQVIGILSVAWKKDAHAWTSDSIMGMAAFWLRYHDGDPRTPPECVDRERLIRIMQESGCSTMMSKANQQKAVHGGSSYANWGRALRATYNAKMRKQELPEWERLPISEEDVNTRTAALQRYWDSKKAEKAT